MENKEKIEYLFKKIDIEIGSTITYSDNEEKVLENIQRANLCKTSKSMVIRRLSFI